MVEEKEEEEKEEKEKVLVNNLKTSYQDHNQPLVEWLDLGGQIQFLKEDLKLKFPKAAFQQQQNQ